MSGEVASGECDERGIPKEQARGGEVQLKHGIARLVPE